MTAPSRHRALGLRRPARSAALALTILATVPGAAAAATRYASSASTSTGPNCLNAAAPCSLQAALLSANRDDTVSLAADGTYDVAGLLLAPVPLHWVSTDPGRRPLLKSQAAAPALTLTPGQSGSSFDGLEIESLSPTAQPAILVQSGVSAAVRNSVVTGPRCIDAPGSGEVTIDDSNLSATSIGTCLTLGPMSTISRSDVTGATVGIIREGPPPAVLVSSGLVEDTTVTGGLDLAAPTAVARRVRASGGASALSGQGLVVDSLVTTTAPGGAAIAADAPGGASLAVVNTTAVSTRGPALLVAPSLAATGPTVPNDLEVTNSIARGAGTDIEVTDHIVCSVDIVSVCPVVGQMRIDHSEFATRAPLASARDAAVIAEGAGNTATDPRFVDPAGGDYHLQAGSPAIDAGTTVELSLPTDLDGRPRVQGAAPDLGAFESSPPPPPPAAPPPPPPPPPPHLAPVLSHLIVSPSAVRFGPAHAKRSRPVRIMFTLSEDATVRIAFAKAQATRGRPRQCARLCTRYVAIGSLSIRGRRGVNAISFAGAISVGRRLRPGTYQLTATPTDVLHSTGLPQTTRLIVLPARG